MFLLVMQSYLREQKKNTSAEAEEDAACCIDDPSLLTNSKSYQINRIPIKKNVISHQTPQYS